MNLTNIANFRLISQQVAGTKFKTAKELVGWMGAMQAQDYSMSKWAIGIRLQGATDKTIEKAVEKGEIIRTHLLRPTWHFVSADDIYWMLELSAPQINRILKSRHNELGLTKAILSKSNAVMEKSLVGGKHLTRDELRGILEKAKIAPGSLQMAHLLLQAELDGIICSGATRDKKQTYSLLAERVKKRKTLTRDESLAKLAERYFKSHCPATVQDFTWWSGLPAADARHAVEMVKSDFISEKIGPQTYWFTDSFSFSKASSESVHLLPAYDEYIISYRDRSAALSVEINKKTVSDNGIFRPVIVINGQVKGLWKRTTKKDKVLLETQFFKKPGKTQTALIGKASNAFSHFLNQEIEVHHH